MDANDLDAVDVPSDLACVECGERIERGYLPVDDDGPRADGAVCDECGWGRVGMNGCAPTLDDFDGDPAALVRVGPGDDDPVVEAVTERRD